MKRSVVVCFLASVAAMAGISGGAQAQGVFDLGALTNTLSIPTTAPNAVPPAVPTSAQTAKLNFTPSAEIRKSNIGKFVAGMKQINADMGNALEQAFAQTDIFAMMDSGLAEFGLRTNNIADAYTYYLISGWMAANGRTDKNTKEQALGTKAMVEQTFVTSTQLLNLSDADKQSTAEGLFLQGMMYDMMLEGSASDPQALQKVQTDVRAALKEFGIDPDNFTLTADGLQRAKK